MKVSVSEIERGLNAKCVPMLPKSFSFPHPFLFGSCLNYLWGYPIFFSVKKLPGPKCKLSNGKSQPSISTNKTSKQFWSYHSQYGLRVSYRKSSDGPSDLISYLALQTVIDANIFPVLIDILQKAEFRTRKEAAWAITNATSGGTPEQIRWDFNEMLYSANEEIEVDYFATDLSSRCLLKY